MERKYSESTLASFGRAFLLFAALTSTTSFAIDEICSPTVDSNPVPEVEGQVNKLNCATKDAFQNSCAYQDWLNRDAKESPRTKYIDRITPFVDPKCRTAENPCQLGKTDFAVAKALGNPEFVKYLEKTAPSDVKVEDVERNMKLDQRQRKDFADYRKWLASRDPLGATKASMILMSDQTGTTPEQQKKILTEITDHGLRFQAGRMGSCPNAKAVVRPRQLATRWNGPLVDPKYTGIEAQGNKIVKNEVPKPDPVLAKDMIKKSNDETAKYRSFDGIIDSLVSCEPAVAENMMRVGKVYGDCEIKFPQTIFPDNSPRMTDAAMAEIQKALEADECYKNAKKFKLPLLSVTVAASANTLHNGGDYCKWDFEKLSKDRVTSLREKTAIFLGDELKDLPIGINFAGDRGDGSSGPCAYVATEVKGPGKDVFEVKGDDGVTRFFTETRRPEYVSNEGKQKLAESKYARVNVVFGEKAEGPKVQVRGPHQERISASCKIIDFECK